MARVGHATLPCGQGSYGSGGFVQDQLVPGSNHGFLRHGYHSMCIIGVLYFVVAAVGTQDTKKAKKLSNR